MLIHNLISLLDEKNLQEHYYICDLTEAKELFLLGFDPVSVDGEGHFAFFKTELLIDFLDRKEK